MTMVQFAERKEEFREKLLAEVKRLKLGEKDMRSMFGSGSSVRMFISASQHISDLLLLNALSV